MTTEHPAVTAVRTKALGFFKPNDKYAIANDPYTFARGKKPAVLLAIVTRKGSLVLAVDETDWLDKQEMVAVMMLEFMGCTPPTAMEKAVEQKKVAPKRK